MQKDTTVSVALLSHSTQDLFSRWAHTEVFIVNPDSGGIQMFLAGHWEGLGWLQHWCLDGSLENVCIQR